MPAKVNKRALASLERSRADHERGLLEHCGRAYHAAHARAWAAEPATILHWIIAELRGTEQADADVCARGAALVRAELEGDARYLKIETFLLHRYRPADLHCHIIQAMVDVGLGTPIGDLVGEMHDRADHDLTLPELAAALEAAGRERGILQESTNA